MYICVHVYVCVSTCVYMRACLCACLHAMTCLLRWQNIPRKFWTSWIFRHWTQFVKFGGKDIYLLSHLVGPNVWFHGVMRVKYIQIIFSYFFTLSCWIWWLDANDRKRSSTLGCCHHSYSLWCSLKVFHRITFKIKISTIIHTMISLSKDAFGGKGPH